MPAEQAEQQAWEDWFLKLSEVPNYYDMSSEQIIYAVTGHMKYNDRVLYGWPDTVSRLRALGKPVTLDAFFAHIRITLFACRETRRSAYKELMLLPTLLSSIADCAALCVRLRQVWARLYPAATSEREPITRQAAILHIHSTLTEAREGSYKSRRGSMLLTALFRFPFSSASLFEDFIADVHHTTVVDSCKNSELYLQALFAELTRAHTLYVNLAPVDFDPVQLALAIQPAKAKFHASGGSPHVQPFKSGSLLGKRASVQHDSESSEADLSDTDTDSQAEADIAAAANSAKQGGSDLQPKPAVDAGATPAGATLPPPPSPTDI